MFDNKLKILRYQNFLILSLVLVTLLFIILSTLRIVKAEENLEKRPLPAARIDQLTGVKTRNFSTQDTWNKKYDRNYYIFGKGPAKFLLDNYHYLPLPNKSKVLDMGMGEGRNAVFLAQKGYQVTGVDISAVAIKKAQQLAKEIGVRIKTVEASFREYPIKEGEFDAIICFYFVDRDLLRKMVKWIRPGGIIFFETFTSNQLKVKGFNSNDYTPQDFINPQELLTLFPSSLKILKYEEPLHESEFKASIILKKEYAKGTEEITSASIISSKIGKSANKNLEQGGKLNKLVKGKKY